MRTWIFQGNPDLFDIDGYLATWPAEVHWSVTRYANEIQSGDQVFLWRNKGKSGVAGVIAEARVIGTPTLLDDDEESKPFWIGEQTSSQKIRATLQLVRVANAKEMLKRDWLEEDPILFDLPNIKMASGTNFKITPEHADRLNRLWSRIGQNWSRSEALAGLYAYIETYGDTVSKRPGSPVAEVSVRIGRPISGVYNKVMNFRHIDPRDKREGLSGGGAADREVWLEFFDQITQTFDNERLIKEYKRLWNSDKSKIDAAVIKETTEQAAKKLEALGIDAIYKRYNESRKNRPDQPRVLQTSSVTFDRNPDVIAIARIRAQYRCEAPDCAVPSFRTKNGDTYCEVHHIKPLSEGGDDTPENVVCLCPFHHRAAHHSEDKELLFKAFLAIRKAAE
jgi:predicted HNH restriction endonuclease